jgi:alkylation response protein AidB-like acyl-CoA dehydrogenase
VPAPTLESQVSSGLRRHGAAAAFVDEVERGLHVPLPGSGDTAGRFRYLEGVAAEDLSVARLLEGHLDALAILAEARRAAPADAIMGVWAARSRQHTLVAERSANGWRLTGRKPYASGGSTLTHALVTAETEDGDRLFLLETRDTVEPVADSWKAIGMRESDSPAVEIDAEIDADAAVGDLGWYTRRAGFWHGAVGVAACWLGGAQAVAAPLGRAASPHALVHLGAVDAQLAAAGALLDAAAREIDVAPGLGGAPAERRARRVRAVVEAAAADAMTRVGRALGAGPLCHDAAHAQRVADLTVYLRQSHAEVDLERLGQLVADDA